MGIRILGKDWVARIINHGVYINSTITKEELYVLTFRDPIGWKNVRSSVCQNRQVQFVKLKELLMGE